MRIVDDLKRDAVAYGRTLGRSLNDFPTWSKGMIAVLVLAACALVSVRGGVAAIAFVLISVLAVTAIANWVARPEDQRWMMALALLAIAFHDLLVGAIDVAVLASTGARIFAPDEGIYFTTAQSLVRHWNDAGAPFDAANYYNGSLYVQLVARIMFLFGDNFLLPKLVNAFLAVCAGLLVYRVSWNLGLRGPRWAAALYLWFPSFVFWSALGLKDAYVAFFLIASLWTSSEFVRTRRPAWLVATPILLLPLESVRTYIFVTAALAWLALPLALSPWRLRLRVAAFLVPVVALMFLFTDPFRDLGPNPIYIPVITRNANAQASSAFITPPPVVTGQPGDRFIVGLPGVTPQTERTPQVVVASPGTQIEVVKPGTPSPTPSGSPDAHKIVVQPGDIVVIGGPTPAASAPIVIGPVTTSPSPSPQPTVVVLDPTTKNTVGVSESQEDLTTSPGASLRANLAALPRGLVYSLLAPFPWAGARNLEQLAAIPEMIAWYACLVLALIGTYELVRRRDFRYAQGFAFVVGSSLVLALIEANTGTLIRSRAMLIPFVLMLSAAGLDAVLLRVSAWRSERAELRRHVPGHTARG